MKKIILSLAVFGTIGTAIYLKPDVKGALNPLVTQETLATTVCVPNYTASIRPPASYTTKLKIAQVGIHANLSAWEEDHWIPLVLGGAPTDPKNLWPQPYPEATAKDKVENSLHRDLCNGKITLKQAQDMVRHWKSYVVATTLGGVEGITYDEDDE